MMSYYVGPFVCHGHLCVWDRTKYAEYEGLKETHLLSADIFSQVAR